jgi:hypothetical protein
MLGASGAVAALAGCDSASDSLLRLLAPEPNADFQPPTSAQIDLVAHAINRITYGGRPGEYARVGAMGVDAFIEEQLDPAAIGDRRCDRMVAPIESVHQPIGELYEFNEQRLLTDLTRYKFIRAVHSRRQLFEVMVDFWTDHFNIVSAKGDCQWLKAADDREVIRAHALGNFRDLVRASATSPAMLIYLDGHDNKVIKPDDKPNENYARELMELHTLGVHGGYTQQDVMEVARCLSGWTYENRPFAMRAATVDFDPARHDDGEKLVLGETIPAGGGADDLERVLDLVCAHPSTARYLATKLCRWFIADEPPEEAVTVVARTFTDSSYDIRATLRALFATDSFQSSRGTLFKRPWRYEVSALRATGARMRDGDAAIEFLRRMGHAPFQYPTPDGYPIEPDPWLGTLLWRWNFALDLGAGRLGGVTIDSETLNASYPDQPDLAAHVLGRRPTEEESAVLAHSSQPLGLLLASPAFQWH